MSIDQRLRNGLHASGSDPGPDTLAALRRVEERAARRARTDRLGAAALVAAVILLVVGFGVTLQRERAATDPVVATQAAEGALVGTYVVDVADSRVGREDGMVGRWIVTLTEGGGLELRPPAGYTGATTGAAYRVRGDQLRTDALVEPSCQSDSGFVGTYTWSSSSDLLTFTTIEDRCAARRILFSEQPWTRVS